MVWPSHGLLPNLQERVTWHFATLQSSHETQHVSPTEPALFERVILSLHTSQHPVTCSSCFLLFLKSGLKQASLSGAVTECEWSLMNVRGSCGELAERSIDALLSSRFYTWDCWENVAQQLFVFFLSQHPIIFAVWLLQGLSCLNDDAATLWRVRVRYITDFHKHCVGVAELHVVVK